MRVIGPSLAAVLLGATYLAGCTGEEGVEPPASASATPTSRAAPTALTCTTDERVGTPGGYLARMPDGYADPGKAVEAWLSRTGLGADFAIAPGGGSAWILRSDGTAMAKVHLLRHSGFTVHGYEACSPTL